jgi:hypothetical protein
MADEHWPVKFECVEHCQDVVAEPIRGIVILLRGRSA